MSDAIDQILSALKTHVDAQIRSMPVNRLALVTSYNPADHTAKVTIQPEGIQTGWLPIVVHSTGSMNLWVPLNEGQQVHLTPDTGHGQNWIITGCLFDAMSTPPMLKNSFTGNGVPVAASEAGMSWAGGKATMRFDASGALHIVGPVQIDGDLTVNGDVYDKHGALDRLRMNYNMHEHTGVVTGGGISSTTTKLDPE